MPFGTWDDVAGAVRRALGVLADGDFLILGEPVPDPLPRRGFLGRRPKPAPARYVQVLRIEDMFTAECVGATSLGGTWRMDEATVEHLRELGWRTPAESETEFATVTPNFTLYAAPSAAPTLADLLLASLRLLDVRPGDLELQLSD